VLVLKLAKEYSDSAFAVWTQHKVRCPRGQSGDLDFITGNSLYHMPDAVKLTLY
jgi:hypothetical protein